MTFCVADFFYVAICTLHGTWVVTRSKKGRVRLYCVPAEDRGAYRDWQRARAALVKLTAELLRQLDALADQRLTMWPTSVVGHRSHRQSPAVTAVHVAAVKAVLVY